jgi:hypothetical protein
MTPSQMRAEESRHASPAARHQHSANAWKKALELGSEEVEDAKSLLSLGGWVALPARMDEPPPHSPRPQRLISLRLQTSRR